MITAKHPHPTSSLNGYEILAHVQAGFGDKTLIIGQRGKCRFCGTSGPDNFKNRSHTFPEGLGNRWIISADECDVCNKLFAVYENALCSSVGPILTVGGTKGKKGKVRQTGRSRGSHNVRHISEAGKRHISFQMMSTRDEIETPVGSEISFGPDQKMTILVPAPDETFTPRLAYKALAKMGLSLLPADLLPEFSKLRDWVLQSTDNEDFPFLDVGMSVGSLGNAPELVSGTILRRQPHLKNAPYAIFILTAGSVCWQLDLMPNTLDDHIGVAPFGCININWNVLLGPEDDEQLEISYSAPKHLDWSSRAKQQGPIAGIRHRFDGRTLAGSFELVWRDP